MFDGACDGGRRRSLVDPDPARGHSTRYEYVLTDKGRDFFPAYLALKKWGDDWLAEPEGPQVVFRERTAGRAIEYPELLSATGKPLRLEDVEVVAGSGAIAFNRERFGGIYRNTRAERCFEIEAQVAVR